MDKEKERDLVRRAKAGNKDAFRQLFEEYKGMALRVALFLLEDRDEAEEQVIEAFLKAWESLDTFEGKSSFHTWVYRIVVNLCKNELRRQGRKPATPVSTIVPDDLTPEDAEDWIACVFEDKTANLENIVIKTEETEALKDAIDRLPNGLKDVCRLSLAGLSESEIADILGIPLGTVRSRMHTAKRILREALKRYLSSDMLSI